MTLQTLRQTAVSAAQSAPRSQMHLHSTGCTEALPGRLLVSLSLCVLLAGCQTPLPHPDNSIPRVIEHDKTDSTSLSPQTSQYLAEAEHNSAEHQVVREHSAKVQPVQWEKQIHPLFLQARLLVEQETGISLNDIALMLVDDAPINAEVNLETRRLVNEQFGPSSFAERFLERVMDIQSGTYAALFTSRLKAVMVSRSLLSSFEKSVPADQDTRSAALLTLLIHELVHAADDKRFHIHDNRALNFRASFAQSATFEGHAQWVTRKICAQHGCSAGLDALDNFMFSRGEQSREMTQPVQAISRNVLEYSYIEGERFIESLAARPNGAQLIEQLLQSPPYDPIQILAPERYPDIAREQLNQRLIRVGRSIDHPWIKGDWIGVETSPLKGVNLRSDPLRRQAAIDGFTRLIEGMVAMQLFDRSKPEASPVEVTLLQAESASTASLFARTLHENTQVSDSLYEEEPVRVKTGAGAQQSMMSAHLFRTRLDDDKPFRTTIAVSGLYVVQIAGNSRSSLPLDDYALRVLLNLHLTP